jgi:hypothetical protein
MNTNKPATAEKFARVPYLIPERKQEKREKDTRKLHKVTVKLSVDDPSSSSEFSIHRSFSACPSTINILITDTSGWIIQSREKAKALNILEPHRIVKTYDRSRKST